MNNNAINIIKHVRLTLGLNSPQLSQKLGFKGKGHVWHIEKGYRNPSVLFCKRLIQLAKNEANIDLTLEMLL